MKTVQKSPEPINRPRASRLWEVRVIVTRPDGSQFEASNSCARMFELPEAAAKAGMVCFDGELDRMDRKDGVA